MATIITITKDDTAEAIQEKLRQAALCSGSGLKGFDAKKFTGKVKSFGDALLYQRRLRDEWQ